MDFDNGKYTVVFEEHTGNLYALRHGKPWRDLTGDQLILSMLQTCESMDRKFKVLLEASRTKIPGSYMRDQL